MWDTIRYFFAPPLVGDRPESIAQLIWLVRLRWLALTATMIAIVPALEFHMLEARHLPWFLGVVLSLATVNAATWVWMRGRRRTTQPQIMVQLCADITALSLLLGMTGGAWNPLLPILLVHSVLGAMLLEGRYSLAFFFVIVLCLGLIQANSHIPPGLSATMVRPIILFPAQFVIALVFWILTTWLSRTLRSLQKQVSEAQERKTRIDRLRAVGALAAGLSHEFATPLNTAQLRLSRLGRAHDLESDDDLVTAREELERCGEVLKHMAGSQLRPERLELEAVDVDLLAKQVVTSISRVHDDVTVRFSVEGRGPRRAVLPSVAFSQALINLIDNAIESAGPELPVDVTVRSVNGRVELLVADQGEGWPTMVRSHLGEPFVTTKRDGVGLGLYFVHSLSEAMGAELNLDDREGGGAIARISLPAMLPGEPGLQEVQA